MPSSRHIGILFEFPTLNGGEHSLLAVIQLLRGLNFRFTAIAPPQGPLAERLADLEVPVVPFSVRSADGVKREQQQLDDDLQSILQNHQLHLLHSNSLSMSRFVGGFKRRTGNSTNTTGHLRDIIKLSKAAVADLNQNGGLIAVSHATRDFHASQGLKADICDVIHNGISGESFTAACSPADRSELFPHLSADAKILLNVGQICLRKAQRDLGESVCRILNSRDDVHLVLVGERHSTKQESVDYEQSIRQCFADCGRLEHLHMFGYRDDVARFMSAADLLVHTSRQEPFGRTLLEAAATRLPIIATDVGGTAEMLRPSEDAVLVPANDQDVLDQAITNALDSPEDCQSRSRQARDRVASEFSVEKTAAKTASFWDDQLSVVVAAE